MQRLETLLSLNKTCLKELDFHEPLMDIGGIFRETANGPTFQFRPTMGAFPSKNWLLDLCLRKITWKSFKVHDGFLCAWLCIRNKVADLLTEYLNNKPETTLVHLCGHSLGGAIAMIAYQDLIYMFPQLRFEVTTSGSPRVFAGKVPNNYSEQIITRFVNDCDWATHVPSSFLGYKHIGKKIQVGNAKRFWSNFFGFATNAHNPDSYLANKGVN